MTDGRIIAKFKQEGADCNQEANFLFDQYAFWVFSGKKRYSLSLQEAKDAYSASVISLIFQIRNGQLTVDKPLKSHLWKIFIQQCKNKVQGIPIQQEKTNAPSWEDQLHQFSERFDQLQLIDRQLIWRRIVWIAGVGLLLAAFFLIPRSVDKADLFDYYYQRPPAREKESIRTTDMLIQANVLFNQEEFGQAALAYKEIIADSSSYAFQQAQFFLGITDLELGRPAAAIQQLSRVSSAEFEHKVHWFTTLIHLKEMQIDEAKVILTKISKRPNHYYHQKAVEILGHLED